MAGFNTYQTTKLYDDALLRHAQYIRWMRSLLCPCVSNDTSQPDPQCDLCKGRGRVYLPPEDMVIRDEVVKHDSNGHLYPKQFGITDVISVVRKDVALTVTAFTSSMISIAEPYPKGHEVVTVSYKFKPEVTVTVEDSTVHDTNMLKTIATVFEERGKTFEGTVISVSRAYNVTKAETYTVAKLEKEYIHLTDMGTWEAGDVLEIDYIYLKPYKFLFTGISQRIRRERTYILDEADALLMTPSWVRFSPDDLFTLISGEQTANTILDPTVVAGNDMIHGYFDVSQLLAVMDTTGKQYTVGTDVELFGRDEIKWNITKPTVPYSIQFTYHPTFTALTNYSSVRNSEDKVFVNRINLKQFDRLDTVVDF